MASDEPVSPDQPNVVPNQVHLALTSDELATIVIALRAIGAHTFARRLDAVLRRLTAE